jgi:hypothetical protein
MSGWLSLKRGRHTLRRRCIQYAAAYPSKTDSLEYWITRFRK